MSHAERSIQVLLTDAGGGAPAHVRRALAGCADLSLRGAAGGGRTALALAAELLPEVAVVGDDPATIRAIRASSPATNVVVVAAVADRDRILDAIDAGAGGYLLAGDDPASLPDAIRAAARGEVHLDPAVAGRLARHLVSPPTGIAALTSRERTILALVARGLSNREIAAKLFIGERTARTHVSHVLSKLQLASRTQAALVAIREGLIPPPGM
jgi:DNA-binding NarL/FixJ family response regulator